MGAISGIIGIMNHMGVNFLGVITKHSEMGSLNRAKINKVAQVKLLPLKVNRPVIQPRCRNTQTRSSPQSWTTWRSTSLTASISRMDMT
jgi:hypothetical protein